MFRLFVPLLLLFTSCGKEKHKNQSFELSQVCPSDKIANVETLDTETLDENRQAGKLAISVNCVSKDETP
jgi:hypothetical protein